MGQLGGRRRRVAAAGGAALLALTAACDDGGGSAEPTADEYLAQLDAVCAATGETLDALPSPPEEITVADFATEAASALTDEAEAMRGLDPPSELEADHRALVANTDDQARAWTEMGAVTDVDAAELEAASVRIGELTLGRNDLAGALGADDCVRGAG